MKSALVYLLGMVVFCSWLAADEPTQTAASKALRDQCHAYFYYTAALAESDNKARMALLDKAIDRDPENSRAFYNRGVLYLNVGDLARAKTDFQKAIQLNENHIFAHYNLACVLCRDAQLDGALASLEKALAKGYRKFDKIANDPDFENLKEKSGFSQLIAKYQAQAAKTRTELVAQISDF